MRALATPHVTLPGDGAAGLSSGALIAGAVALLALPSAVLGFALRLDSPAGPADRTEAGYAPRTVDERLAHALSAAGGQIQALGASFRFTPAGIAARPDRQVTVAVRVDPSTAQAIIVRARAAPPPATPLRLATSGYSLSAPLTGTPAGRTTLGDIRRIDMPDLASFGHEEPAAAPSRLSARIALDASERAGRSARTLESLGTQTLEAGGAYRLSRNLDVTAGVRYQRDRDRLQPPSDARGDTQAVFVGTQFRF